MRLNRSGFTLVEMLAVVVILGLLVTIMVPTVNHLIEENKKNNVKSLKSSIISAARTYLSDYRYEIVVSDLPCANGDDEKNVASVNDEMLTGSKISLETLVTKKYLKGDIKNPFNRENLNLGKIYVVVKYVCSKKDYSYSISDESASGLTWN